MANQEEILDALCSYEKKPSNDIPPVLEDYLRQVAKTGETIFPWPRLKPLFIRKLDQVMEQFNQEVPFDNLTPYPNVENAKYEEVKRRVIEAFEKFSGPPFTVQRICELVTEPRKHYQRSDKFLRGVEKNVMVVSTVDPYGKKISAELPRGLMNGVELNGFSKPRDDGEGLTENAPFPSVVPPSWTDSLSVATIWPSVFPENTVSKPNVSTNAMDESVQDKSSTESVETEKKLDSADKTDRSNVPEIDSEKKENDFSTVNSEDSVAKDGTDIENNKGATDSAVKQSETDVLEKAESLKTEGVVDDSVEKTEDSAETGLSNETRTTAELGTENKTVTDTEQVEEVERHETEEQNQAPREDTQASGAANTESEKSPSPETSSTETTEETDDAKHAEESRNLENYATQSDQSEPVIEPKEQSENQSECASSDQSAESETPESKTESVDQSSGEIIQTEVLPHIETALQNEADGHQPHSEVQPQSQNEAEAEEMESSSEEHIVTGAEVNESEVKDSDEISSSEGMDIDTGSGKSEAHSDAEVVSTSDQGTEEPMEQE